MKKNIEAKQRFPDKLQEIIQDSNIQSTIRLNQEKFAIQILDENQFSSTILPLFFRHSRIESFFRQLNLYGFQKIRKQAYHCFYHPQLEKGTKISQILSKKESQRRKLKEKRQKFLNKKKLEESNIQNSIQQKCHIPQMRQENANFFNMAPVHQSNTLQAQYMSIKPQIYFFWPYWRETPFYSFL